MNFLFEVEFTINLGSLFAFLTGIVSGIILFIMFYLLYVAIYLNKQEVIIENTSQNVTKEQVEEEIKKTQEKFLQIRKETHEVNFDTLKDLIINLMNSIARLYYPESKHPLSELTIKELLLLDEYLLTKIENLLNKVGLRFVKKIKLCKILDILNMKRAIDANNVVKATKKISKFSGKLMAILNFVNPVMWIKRGIINPSINLITKKICLLIIATIGQETHHIYSKQAFLDPILDNELEQLINVIETDNTQSIETNSTSNKKDKIKL